MHCMLQFVLVAVASAQTPQGIAPAWDVRSTLRTLSDNARVYKEQAEKLRVADWIAKGAPAAYERQQQVVVAEAGYLRQSSAKLADDPERLSLLVDVLFRLESLEELTSSLSEASNRYQDAETARTLGRLLNENAATRVKLRQYLLDLSQTKEQEQATALKEAQRCQTVLNQNPLAPPPSVARQPKSAPKK